MTLSPSSAPFEPARFIRAGDGLIWGQACAEPVSLVSAVARDRALIGPVSAFVGLSLSDALAPEHTDVISVSSYGAMGTTARLMKAGALAIRPCLYSALPGLIETGAIPADVVLIQVSPPGPDGTHSLGMCADLLPAAMRRARVVIAEINSNVPWTRMAAPLDESRIAFTTISDAPLPELAPRPPGEVERRIAAHAAAEIPERATLQYGIGAVPVAILDALGGHRDLGIHSGLATDQLVDLVEAGAVTNARKRTHAGISIVGTVIGGAKIRRFLHDNPAVELHPIESTHGPAALAALGNLVAINSALEVDIRGQANAEVAGARYLGGIGGQVDYMTAASSQAQGISIIAMPSTDAKSGRSRIVSTLEGRLVTTSRAAVDMVITEHGAADLRGATEAGAARALIAIAAPEHREALARAAHGAGLEGRS
ncbi:MAG: acetyl-CoA hydrolase/transferase C-terminal domain-containing protein [Paracoccaceae bacterium]